MGKCPSCQNLVGSLSLRPVDARLPNGDRFNAVLLLCPSCQGILGAEIDPITVRTEVIDGVVSELQKRGLLP